MSTGAGKLDEFESLFRSALHDVFRFSRPTVEHAVLVTDADAEASAPLLAAVQQFLSRMEGADAIAWSLLDATRWAREAEPIPALLALLEQGSFDLVVSPRHLLGAVRDLPHTLGSVLDTLTQAQPIPVLVLPAPDPSALPADGTRVVLAVTDRMTGHDELVSWAVHAACRQGTVVLAHIEDDTMLERYLDVISRIRDLDSETARVQIPAKLLDLPRDYLASIDGVLKEEGIEENVVSVVRMGHALSDYLGLVDEHGVDLMLIDSKDDRQTAMHGLAHALAVELRHRPLLML